MQYFNLNDVPFAIIAIGENLWESESGFQTFLEQQGIYNTSGVEDAKWASVLVAITKLENQ